MRWPISSSGNLDDGEKAVTLEEAEVALKVAQWGFKRAEELLLGGPG